MEHERLMGKWLRNHEPSLELSTPKCLIKAYFLGVDKVFFGQSVYISTLILSLNHKDPPAFCDGFFLQACRALDHSVRQRGAVSTQRSIC